jgi:hypothetical protein
MTTPPATYAGQQAFQAAAWRDTKMRTALRAYVRGLAAGAACRDGHTIPPDAEPTVEHVEPGCYEHDVEPPPDATQEWYDRHPPRWVPTDLGDAQIVVVRHTYTVGPRH